MSNKKGFLFVVTVFLILSYILLSISVWVKAIESSERAYSEFYKESTVELAIEQITDAKVTNLSHMIMERSVYHINDHAIENPVVAGEDGNELSNVSAAMNELLVYGRANSEHFETSIGLEEENSSMTAWVENLNVSLLAIGVYIDKFEIYDFAMSQSDIDTVNYSYRMNLSMKDAGNKASVSREYFVEDEIDISGLVDPAIVRGSIAVAGGGDRYSPNTIYRMYFFESEGNYRNPSELEPSRLGGYSVQGGMGWFYGYLVSASGAAGIEENMRGRYIIVGDFDDIVRADPDQVFGGYIVTSAPGTSDVCAADGFENQEDAFNAVRHDGPACDEVSRDCAAGECTSVPFIEAVGFDISSAPHCPVLELPMPATMPRCALFINENPVLDVLVDPDEKLGTAGAGIYDVEDMRDYIMCGYYTHSEESPSFLQRFFSDAYERSSAEYGIETFVIGEYASDDAYDRNSRLDRELFAGTDGSAVRGMTGCKNYQHCADDPSTGVFTLDTDYSIPAYGLGDIYCAEAEGCEE